MEDLRYPIGKFDLPDSTTAAQRDAWTGILTTFPADLRAAVEGLSSLQLDTPYREGGWTIRQVVHHVADSHMNGYIRVKLALTEVQPMVKTYDEARWAELADAALEIEPSLRIVDNLHIRWVDLFRSLDDTQLARTFRHPDWGLVRLDQQLGLYAWHSRHHLAHIQGGLARAAAAG
ncbi:MAG: bacillithiol transferase BstA [Acidobacteriota bacterium]